MSNRPLLIEERLSTRWGDMDALGHVNNAAYFVYLETVRVSWLRQVAGADWGSANEGPVLVQASCDFIRPVLHPAELSVRMYARPPGNSSVVTEYEIRDAGNPDVLYATGVAKMVWVDYSAGRSRRLPDALRAALPAS